MSNNNEVMSNLSVTDFLKLLFSGTHHYLKYTDTKYSKIDKLFNITKEADSRPEPEELDEKHDECIRENVNYNDRITCGICMTNLRNVVFKPCNHVFACNACSMRMQTKKCPCCRSNISEFINIRLP
jgi:hypothetical protein